MEDDGFHQKIHTRTRNTISEGFVASGVGSIRDVCEKIRKSLQSLTFQRREAPYQIDALDHAFILVYILIVDSLVITVTKGSNLILIGLHDQISCIFMLSGALSANDIISLKISTR